MNYGTLFGISVGPGDPELITVKALRTMERCPVIAVPRTGGARTLALDIARQATDLSQKENLYLDHRMVRDPAILQGQYRENAAAVAAYLQRGLDVALLNLGDASVYSTYCYIAEEVKSAGYACQMIPGVPSFCACAALLGQSLTEATLPLSIFPGSYEDLEGALDTPGGKILMKSAKALPALEGAIAARGLSEKTWIVSDCGLPGQSVRRVGEGESGSYFTTVVIRP